ncbi:MAG: transposase [Candidatus Cloacimonetes bacterium]|nr:transposase [Candidatus Cloacimonadota bacterium]
MIKVRNQEQISIPGLETWRTIFSLKKLSILENSWAGVFRKHILSLLPAEQLFKLYTFNRGRPTKELFAIVGAAVLQQFFDLTDEETIEELAFNQQWHFALECFAEEDQIISLKTLWTMRNQLVKHGLSDSIFSVTTDRLLKYFDVDVSKQRLDSVHVHSNMARLGRIRILVRTMIKFIENLKRQNLELFENEISSEMIEKYLKKSDNNYFGQVKPSATERTLQLLAEDMYALKLNFENEEKVSQMSSFKLLERVFSEHCFVESGQVQVRSSKEVSSASVQNPSDPDAGYDGYKGQGYQTQILETYTREEDRENPEEPKLDLITYVETESADKHDSNALEPAIKDVKERGLECEKILADTLYGGNENVEKAKKCGVKVVAPIPGKPSENGLDSFEYNSDSLEIISCPAGKKPDKIKHNKKPSITSIWYEQTCANCPFADSCPTREGKQGRKFYYTKDSLKSFFRRKYEESIEFEDEYRYRSGIEATNSRFILMTSARRSRYRGLEKMKFAQKLKALAINVFRVVKYRKKLGKSVDISYFSFNNFIFSSESDFKLEFAA